MEGGIYGGIGRVQLLNADGDVLVDSEILGELGGSSDSSHVHYCIDASSDAPAKSFDWHVTRYQAYAAERDLQLHSHRRGDTGNWACCYCGRLVPVGAYVCPGCGAPRTA